MSVFALFVNLFRCRYSQRIIYQKHSQVGKNGPIFNLDSGNKIKVGGPKMIVSFTVMALSETTTWSEILCFFEETVKHTSSEKTNNTSTPNSPAEFGTSPHFSILLISSAFTTTFSVPVMVSVWRWKLNWTGGHQGKSKKVNQTSSDKLCFL